MPLEALIFLIFLAALIYVWGAMNWAAWWARRPRGASRARALLATPIYPIPAAFYAIRRAHRYVSHLIIEARLGRRP